MSQFNQFAGSVWAKGKYIPPTHQRIIAYDPGETTGWAAFSSSVAVAPDTQHIQHTHPQWRMDAYGQLVTWPMPNAVHSLTENLITFGPQFVVYERYAVYGWKAQDHSWSEVPAVQVIGTIQTLCVQYRIPTINQTAQQAKHFCTDAFLKKMGMYPTGQRHAKDAIRHGLFWILFGNQKPQ